MIYSLQALIPPSDVQVQVAGRWLASMPLPFYPGLFDRLRDAWEVLTERAVAVHYPKPGDFEQACHQAGWKVTR